MVVGKIRGTHNYLDYRAYKYVIDIFWNFSYRCGFCPCKLASLQPLEFFTECGAESDILAKEVISVQYAQLNKTIGILLPECTNPLTRILKDLDGVRHIEQKLAYCQSLWRYNRPQKGRFREFTQCGWESFDPITTDLEMIYYAAKFLEKLQLPYTLYINHLGDSNYQKEYALFIKEFLIQNNYEIMHTNYLRLLDKKEINFDTPFPLPEEYETYLIKLVQDLQNLKINAQINRRLVRGLDYYQDIIFEFHVEEQAILAGGRYDRITQDWKHPVKATGWALGVERAVEYINYIPNNKIIYFTGSFDSLIKLRELNLPISNCQDTAKFFSKGFWIIKEQEEFKFYHKNYKEGLNYSKFKEVY